MIKHEHEGFVVYEFPYTLPDQDKVLDEVHRLASYIKQGARTRDDILQIYKTTKSKVSPGPGVQVELHYSNGEYLSKVPRLLGNKVLEFHNTNFDRKGEESFTHSWAYISHPENKDSNFHTHEFFSTMESQIVTTWTITYYLEVPDNCQDDEGKLLFSTSGEDSNALKLFPKKNTIYIFNGTLSHKPEIAPNSTKSRVVLAANVAIPLKDKVLI